MASRPSPAKKAPRARRTAAEPVVAQAAPAKKSAPPEPPAPARAKLVRDSFTMPQDDFALIAQLKARALEFKRPAKKSELLRAGLQVLAKLNDKALRAALDRLTPLKAGRPKKAD